MKNTILLGNRTGKFNLLYYTNTQNQPISSYNNFIVNVATLNSAQTQLLFYRPNQISNPFTHFEQNKFYLIFAKKTFSIELEDFDFTQTKSLTGDSVGRYNFVIYPHSTNRPFDSFENNPITEIQYISNDNSIITTYKANQFINKIESFKPGAFLVKAKSNFSIYNYDEPALVTENNDFILLEQNGDRLMFETE